MKVLVTGGAGFIGSNLVDAVIAAGHHAVVVDNFATGTKNYLNPRASFFEVDICDRLKLEKLFEGVEVVFHVAALPRVPLSIEKPQETHQMNVDGTLNVLLAARDKKVRRVVFSSSSSVYGTQKTLPLHEELTPNPLSPYALQKLIGEYYARIFSQLYGLETVSLRYFNVYGPRQSGEGPYATAIAKFLEKRSKNEPLPIFGSGEKSRDFTHVRDVVKANLLAAQGKRVGEGEVINIGAGKNYTINQVAEIIGGERQYFPDRPGEPQTTLADTRKAKELLGWEPTVSLEDGIRELLR